MSEIAHSITINRPIADVFAFVANLENDEKWWAPVASTQQITPGPIQPGTQFIQHAGIMFVKVQNDITVKVWQPPHYARYRNDGRQLPFDLEYTFTAQGKATIYQLKAELAPSGILKLLTPLTIWTLNRQLQLYFQVLKHLLEKGAA